jgi:hypothetical protein
MKEIAKQGAGEVLDAVISRGDLSKLTPAERVLYYRRVCESLGLNPLTRPFEYIVLNGRLTLYARKDATDQLRRLHGVSIQIVARERLDDVYIVTARATTPDGRTDESTGAVSIAGLKGEALATALMKAETKAKRRVTLSIVGLGWLDESEVDSIPDSAPQADMSSSYPQDEQEEPFLNEEREALLRNALKKLGMDEEHQDRIIEHWRATGAGRDRIRTDLEIIQRNRTQWKDEIKSFWAWAGDKGLSSQDVHKLTGLPTIYMWQGTLAELQQEIDEALRRELA